MAFDLIGRIKIKDDGASKALQKISQATRMTQKATEQYRESAGRLRNTHGQMESQGKRTVSVLRGLGIAASGAGRAFSSARSQSAGLMRTVVGLGAAYLSFRSAAGLVNMSVGGAANLELQGIQLEALIGNAQKAKTLFDSMNAKGLVSSFSESDFLEGAKAFLPLTKDLKQIDTLTSLQERLASSNPLQGMEGSAFSIREALSGDTVSLVERFNIPKSMVVNLRKTTSMNGKIKELDKILTKMGFTQEYLNKVNKSASAQWSNLGSNIRMKFARAGKEALETLKPLLNELNAFLSSDRGSAMFQRWGQALGKLALAAANFGRWLMDKGGAAFDYLDRNYFSNPKFQKLPFADKIHTVFAEIETKFNAWYSGGGKTMMENGAEKLVNYLGNALKASAPLLEAALKIGTAIATGVINGFWDAIKNDPKLAAILGGTAGAMFGPTGVVAGAAIAGGASVINQNKLPPKPASEISTWEKLLPSNWSWLDYASGTQWMSHASGLDRVPYNGYPAMLHKDETVLPKTEASAHRDGKGGGSAPSVLVTGNTFNVRNDGDVDAIARRLAHHLAQ